MHKLKTSNNKNENKRQWENVRAIPCFTDIWKLSTSVQIQIIFVTENIQQRKI